MAAHGDTSKLSLRNYVQPEFAQFVNYCSALNLAQAQFAAVATSVVSMRPGAVTITTGTTTRTRTNPAPTVRVAATTVASINSSAISGFPAQFTGSAAISQTSIAGLLSIVAFLGFCFI